jgi:archaellum component FlaC
LRIAKTREKAETRYQQHSFEGMDAMEARVTSEAAEAATNEAVATPSVWKFESQRSTPRRPTEEPIETGAKRKRDGGMTDSPSKKLREGGAERSDEPISSADENSPVKDNSGEQQEAESESERDPVPLVTGAQRASAEPDEAMLMDHQSQNMASDDAAMILNTVTMETQPGQALDDPTAASATEPTSEVAEKTVRAAGYSYIYKISEMLDSKEGNLLSALLSISMAGREMNDESHGIDQYKKARHELRERIDEIERNAAGFMDSDEELVQQSIVVAEKELASERARLQSLEEEVNYCSWRFEAMKERVVSTCQDLCDSEASDLTDLSHDVMELYPIKSLAENDELWEMLDRYKHASWRTKVATEELDALRQQRSAIAKSTKLSGKLFLCRRIAGIDADDVDPKILSMPGLCLASQMMQKEVDLRETLEKYKIEDVEAMQMAFCTERALIKAGLLMPSAISEHLERILQEASPAESECDSNGSNVEARVNRDNHVTPLRMEFANVAMDLRVGEGRPDTVYGRRMAQAEAYRAATGQHPPRNRRFGQEDRRWDGGPDNTEPGQSHAHEEARSNELPDGNWLYTFEGIRSGRIIMFQEGELVGASDSLEDEDLSWSPKPLGHMRPSAQFVIVSQSFRSFMDVYLLMAFEDMRYALQGYLHVVALDGHGSIRSEPECFEGGVQCNWRSFEDVPLPSNKNWFTSVDMPRAQENVRVCVVGELAEYKDIAILRRTRQAYNDYVDRADDQEIQLREAEEAQDPVGLSVLPENRNPRSVFPAVENRGQGFVYEDRDYVEPERRSNAPWSYDD